jgi:hypothetical protein
MDLFATGEKLQKKFPESKLIPNRELDPTSSHIIRRIADQIRWSAKGIVGYPLASYLTSLPAIGFGAFGCITLHALTTSTLEKELARHIHWQNPATKYTHIIVDRKGNLLLVKEPKKGAMKRFVSQFYLAHARLSSEKPKKGPIYRGLRAAQRKLWPRRTKPT